MDKIRERLELALRPFKKPSLGEVLRQVSTDGVLRGPVDWVFEGWKLYIEYAVREIMKTFPLNEEEEAQLLQFRDAAVDVLERAHRQAERKLQSLYRAVLSGTYRVEGNKLYADGAYIMLNKTAHILIHGVDGLTARFPDVLKLPPEELALLQLGWEASDESRHGKSRYATMKTSRPWQVFAWAAVRHGELLITAPTLNLTRGGISILFELISRWKVKTPKEEAVKKALGHPASALTLWLGDGVKSGRSIRRRYAVVEVASKIPLSTMKTRNGTYVVGRRELITQMLNAAPEYGRLLDALRSDKWLFLKTLAEALQHSRPPSVKVTIAGTAFGLRLQTHGGCAIYAVYRSRRKEDADAVAAALEELGIRYNTLHDGKYHIVYVATTELTKLAKETKDVADALAKFLQLRQDKPCAKRLLNSLFPNRLGVYPYKSKYTATVNNFESKQQTHFEPPPHLLHA
jgi:putative sterol carrier protein